MKLDLEYLKEHYPITWMEHAFSELQRENSKLEDRLADANERLEIARSWLTKIGFEADNEECNCHELSGYAIAEVFGGEK